MCGRQRVVVGTKVFPLSSLRSSYGVIHRRSLELDMNEGLHDDVRYISPFGNHDQVDVEETKIIHESVLDTFLRDVLDAAAPNDLRYEILV